LEDTEFIEKLHLYDNLRKQLKSLGNIKNELSSQIKSELQDRETNFLEIDKFRIALSKYERKSLDLQRLIREEKISDIGKYYNKKEYERLDLVEISMGMMEDIS